MANDVVYGVPEQKKFPLPDADHVKSAIKFFNYVEPKYEKQLANEILKRAKIYGVDLTKMNIGDNNRFKGYLPVNELKHSAINKDFYNDLPGMVCIMCDHLVKKYGKEEWFPKAWEEYRQHIKKSDMDHMKMPGFVFNKYVKETEMKHSATNDGQYYWIDEDELMHSRKGWTKKNHKYVRRYFKDGKWFYVYKNGKKYNKFQDWLGVDERDNHIEAIKNLDKAKEEYDAYEKNHSPSDIRTKYLLKKYGEAMDEYNKTGDAYMKTAMAFIDALRNKVVG